MASRTKSPPSIRLVESAAAELRLGEARAFIRDRVTGGALWLVGPSRGAVDDSPARSRASAAPRSVSIASASPSSRRGSPPPSWPTRALHRRPTSGRKRSRRARTFDASAADALDVFRAGRASTPGFPRALARTLQELRLAHVAGAAALPACRSAVPTSPCCSSASSSSSQRHRDRSCDALRGGDGVLDGVAPGDRRRPCCCSTSPFDSAVGVRIRPALIGASPDVLDHGAVRRHPDARAARVDRHQAHVLDRAAGASHGGAQATDLVALRRYLFARRSRRCASRAGDVRVLLGAGRRARRRRNRAAHPRRGAPRRAVRRDGGVPARRRSATSACSSTRSRARRMPAWFDRGTRRPHPAGRAFLALLACAVREAVGAPLRRVPVARARCRAPDDAQRELAVRPAGRRAVARAGRRIGRRDERRRRRSDPRRASKATAGPRTTPRSSTARCARRGSGRADRRIGGDRRRSAALAPAAGRARAASTRLTHPARERARTRSRRASARLERDLHEPGAPARVRAADRRRAGRVAGRGDVGRVARRVRSARADACCGSPDARAARARGAAADGRRRPGVARGGARRARRSAADCSSCEPPRAATAACSSAPRIRRAAARFRVVFVPGLAERVFPQRPREDPLLLDRRDARAARRGAASPGRARQRRAPAAAARRRRARPSGCTCRIRASTSAETRPRVPSFYALDVMRAITGRVPDHDALRSARPRKAARAWPGRRRAIRPRAIDDLEHDLAVLKPLLEPTDPATVRGHAHYLLG